MEKWISMCSVGRCKIVWPLIPDDGQKKLLLICFVSQIIRSFLRSFFGIGFVEYFWHVAFHSEKQQSAQFQLWIYKWDQGTVCSSQHHASENYLTIREYRFRRELEGLFRLVEEGFFHQWRMTLCQQQIGSYCFFLFFVWLFFIFHLNVRIIKLKSFMCSCVCRRVVF